jgi:uncharacterized protein (TIGR02646 family)
MRKVDDYFDDIPISLQSAQLTNTRYKRGQLSILQRILQDSRVKDTDYKGNGDVKTALLDIYAHCCAFCEARISKYDDIEHFRPKHAITDVNTEGYYWLAVEWSNLLIACKVCNSDYKGNYFPISGTRITVPISVDFNDMTSISNFFRRNHIHSSELQSEQPLLLHPVLDNPDDYLFFEMNGTVTAKNNDIKGRTSIQYYGLSDWDNRQILIQDRKEIIESIRKKVYHSVDSYVNDERLYQDLLKLHIDLIRKIESKRPFSAVRRSCLVNFKTFFINCFTGEQEIILNRAYDRVKEDLS